MHMTQRLLDANRFYADELKQVYIDIELCIDMYRYRYIDR